MDRRNRSISWLVGCIFFIGCIAVFSSLSQADDSIHPLQLSLNGENSSSGPFFPELIKSRETFFSRQDTYAVSFELSATEDITITRVYVHTNTSNTQEMIQPLLGFSDQSLQNGSTSSEIIRLSSKEARNLPPTTLTIRLDFCIPKTEQHCSVYEKSIQILPITSLTKIKEDIDVSSVTRGVYEYDEISAAQNRTETRLLTVQELVGFDFMHLLNDTQRERLHEILQTNESTYESFLEEHFTLVPIERSSEELSKEMTDDTLAGLHALNSSSVTDAISDYQESEKASLTKEVVVYRMKHKQSQKSDFVSKIILSYTAEDDTKSFSIVEQIPKEIASQASLLRFNIDPEIIEEDPIVKWSFNDVPKGGSLDISYSVPSRIKPLETQTVVYTSDSEFLSFRGILLIIGVSLSMVAGGMVWSRRYGDRRPQNITITTGHSSSPSKEKTTKNRNI